MNRSEFEQALCALPLYQYAFISTTDLEFSQRIRDVCRMECPMYGKSWACPPGVGTVEACKAKCLQYKQGLLISTITEVSDVADLDETLSTRQPHEEITRTVADLLRHRGISPFVLSTEACAHCRQCTYPDAPCRHPDRMYPCVESHGIVATAIAEHCGIEFLYGGNVVTWYSLLLYNEPAMQS